MKSLRSLLTCLMLFSVFSAFAEEGFRLSHDPYLQNLGTDEVTIVWVANKPSVGWVELAPDGDESFYSEAWPRFFDTKNGIKRATKVHSVRITGLKPGTRYRYRVYSQEVVEHTGYFVQYGAIAATNVYSKKPLSFKTNDYNKPDVSFAVVNDIHGNNRLLENLLKQCDKETTDLVFFNGDMISIADKEEDYFNGFMDKATQLFASEIPMYYVRGNHETRGSFATSFQDYFSPRVETIYQVFRQGPVCFVMLDCGEDKPDTDLEYYGITAYDEYRTEQAVWLKNILESHVYKDASYKWILCHMPGIGDWHGERDIAKKFIPLINNAAPDVMLSGHYHRYTRHEPNDKVSFPLIVNANNMLIKGEVKDNALTLTVYDQQGKMVDRLEIKK